MHVKSGDTTADIAKCYAFRMPLGNAQEATNFSFVFSALASCVFRDRLTHLLRRFE